MLAGVFVPIVVRLPIVAKNLKEYSNFQCVVIVEKSINGLVNFAGEAQTKCTFNQLKSVVIQNKNELVVECLCTDLG